MLWGKRMKPGLVLLICGALLLLWGGKEPIARFALILGAPRLAAGMADDPSLAGVAYYRAGAYAQADDAFRQAGRRATYNRGLSLAMTGDYPLSRAYFDAVLFANPADTQARENRNIVNDLIDPVVGVGNEAGRIATKVIAVPGGTAVEEIKRLGRPLDEGRLVADEAWLEGLADDLGLFLTLRLQAEHQRRLALGQSTSEVGDPW